jgi:hypothetical protein
MYNQIIFLVNQFSDDILPEIKFLILNNYFALDINKKIDKRLKDIFKDELPNFKLLMKKTGCFISGSFIIQCILEEYWCNSDIDIYVPTIGNKIRGPNIFALNGESVDYPFSEVDDFIYNNMNMKDGYANSYPAGIHPGLKWVRDYAYKLPCDSCTYPRTEDDRIDLCGGCAKSYCTYLEYCPTIDNICKMYEKRTRIQIVGIEIEKGLNGAVQFVEETFDFNLCKNLYHSDGIYMKYLKEVILKTTNFKSCKFLGLSIKRYCKYVQRGFSFKNVESGEVSILELQNSMFKEPCINDDEISE